MDRLTDRIVAFGGFIIHYAGDGLAAMWNAPIDQLDHPQRACRAALAMHTEMRRANEQWRTQLQRTLEIGIGINTGHAQVGNSGSKWRIKYAPLGHTVNVASRVEGVTKQVGIRTLVTRATHDKTANDFAFRRLCRVRVAGIDEPIELFELHGETADPHWAQLCNDYEQALSLYERNERGPAREFLQRRLRVEEHSHDIPSQLLLDLASDLNSDHTSGCLFQFGK